MTMTSASSLTRWKSSSCFFSPRSVWLKTTRPLNTPAPVPPTWPKSLAKLPFPNIHPGRLGDEQGHALAVVDHQPLDGHQADEGLAQAHAVAQERAAELLGDIHQGMVALLLVMVQDGVHVGAAVLRACRLPLVGRQAVAAAELVEGAEVNLKGAVITGVPLDDLEDFRRYVLGVVPVLLVPLLEHADRRSGNLHVQLDVLRDARQREVRRADQGEGADHFLPGVGDVGLGVELVLLVDAALDLARADRLHDGRNTRRGSRSSPSLLPGCRPAAT